MTVTAPAILNNGHDSQKFQETHRADPSIPFDTEGGWMISRARFTRRPPITYTLGYTDISEAQKQELQDLYADTRGSSEIIEGWVHPTSGAIKSVRFKQGAIPQYSYKGRGGNHRWDVSGVMIEEV